MERIQAIGNHLLAPSDSYSSELKTSEVRGKESNKEFSIDYYQFSDLLTPKEREIREKAKDFVKNNLDLDQLNKYYEKAEFPFFLLDKLKKLGWVGANIKDYGCPGMGAGELGMVALELSKTSTDLSTFYCILLNISMLPIFYCGSEQQKQHYLPKMASMDMIGAFALTEPEAGSDASGLKCSATKVPGGWRLNGEKRWIGNAPIADVLIVWARNSDTKKIHGFIVEPSKHKGVTIEKMENKIALRSVQNGHIYLRDCFVPDEQQLPLAKDFQTGPGKCLFLTRIVAAWIALGVASNAYEKCLEYVKQRKQFGQPLASFQLVQERLTRMLGNLQGMTLMCLRISQLFDQGKLTYGQVGLLKAHVSLKGREIVSLSRELLGGNGIASDFGGVARNFVDMEAIYTFEGTYDVNSLITGREITGISAFK
ncbi:hypothetical protein CYY_007376 [Polysphondylium violaceum]|uniref:Ig-like domain-containing protein n=1 Tax=Polysphondylium violaceum TaxID=133409 RepID=A0A8J4PQW5_9MYCE|nr:hypothetical protein CYY_007376 [Polysphondylium violaceum]